MKIIKEITASETIPVRHAVLRHGKPLESCRFEGDELPSTKHYGYFEDKNLVGIISVFGNKSAAFAEEHQSQIRGMAVLDNHQKKGIGQQLVLFAEQEILKNKSGIIWFNARITAAGFYKKLGYEIHGDLFDIKDVGPHYMMFQKISG